MNKLIALDIENKAVNKIVDNKNTVIYAFMCFFINLYHPPKASLGTGTSYPGVDGGAGRKIPILLSIPLINPFELCSRRRLPLLLVLTKCE